MQANKMRTIRHYLGLTQEDFAKRLSVSPATICLVEQGKRGMSGHLAARLARIEMEFSDDFYLFSDKFNQNIPS
ncbi:helix-turn-helix transcriptional regulator [Lederbergia citri]|uniref:Helix-turn-helix domain-containing protein n=1 Tax=Lederbergia citri TaxID=2833580 RepID=A0A942TB04_9BACI|nr:helix-turn-helix domain-containing protein [Lederbergia citri]MBS4193486.1 helix-turn-helix domain-containing protein [Lederbergia citri]